MRRLQSTTTQNTWENLTLFNDLQLIRPPDSQVTLAIPWEWCRPTLTWIAKSAPSITLSHERELIDREILITYYLHCLLILFFARDRRWSVMFQHSALKFGTSLEQLMHSSWGVSLATVSQSVRKPYDVKRRISALYFLSLASSLSTIGIQLVWMTALHNFWGSELSFMSIDSCLKGMIRVVSQSWALPNKAYMILLYSKISKHTLCARKHIPKHNLNHQNSAMTILANRYLRQSGNVSFNALNG